MSLCTAPKEGHRNASAASTCPACSPRASASAFPAFTLAPTSDAATRSDAHSQREAEATSDPDLLRTLARHADVHVVRAVADNLDTPPEVLAAFVEHDSEEVRETAAANPSTPGGALAMLAEDPTSRVDVLTAVASNQSTPPETLHALSQQHKWVVRQMVVRNSRTLPETLGSMAGDVSEDVREDVVRNSRTPSPALDLMRRNDPSATVRSLATAQSRARIAHELGVAYDNNKAIDSLLEQDWPALTPESDQVLLATALWRDR